MSTSDRHKPLLSLARPELFKPAVLATLAEFCQLIPDGYFRAAEAYWADPLFPVGYAEAEQMARLRYVLTNTTDTGHVKDLCELRAIEPISLQGMDLAAVTSTADYTELLIRLALRPVTRRARPGRLVRDGNVVILGEHRGRAGRVASQLAPRLRELGARVHICGPANIYRLAPVADVLSVNLPARPEYRNVINAAVLAALRPEAVLVNTARRQLVDEGGVLAALDSGRLARYAVDFKPGAELENHPLCMWSEHVAGFTGEDLARTQLMIATEFRRRLEAEGQQNEPESTSEKKRGS